jgi:hypothetical protein
VLPGAMAVVTTIAVLGVLSLALARRGVRVPI